MKASRQVLVAGSKDSRSYIQFAAVDLSRVRSLDWRCFIFDYSRKEAVHFPKVFAFFSSSFEAFQLCLFDLFPELCMLLNIPK